MTMKKNPGKLSLNKVSLRRMRRRLQTPKVIRAMKKLQGWCSPEAPDVSNASISGREMIIDQANFVLIVIDYQKESTTF